MRVAVGSVRGAPGASTLALALSLDLAGRGAQTLLIEADPVGGVLAARLGIPTSPGLVDFTAAAHHHDIADIAQANVQQMTASLCVLPSPSPARQATAALDALVADLAPLVAATVGNVVVDVGRLLPCSPSRALADAADVLVLAVRPVVAELAAFLPRLRELLDDGARCVAAVLATAPRSAEEPASMAEVAGVLPDAVPVMWLPYEPLAVRQLHADPTGRRWGRTRLALTVGQLSEQLLAYEARDRLDLILGPAEPRSEVLA